MKVINNILTNKRQFLLSIIAILVAGFAGLSYFVIISPPSFLDLHISEEIQERHSVLLDSVMKMVSWFGNVPNSIIMVAFVAVLFFVFNYKKESLFTLLTLGSGLISSGLKILINRPRPTQDLVRIIENAKQQSFPSGHTLFYTIFFGFMIIAMSNLKTIPLMLRVVVAAISAAMIFLVPVSRVYLGAHWFTDVLGGFILGIVLLFLLGYIYLFGRMRKESDEKVD